MLSAEAGPATSEVHDVKGALDRERTNRVLERERELAGKQPSSRKPTKYRDGLEMEKGWRRLAC